MTNIETYNKSGIYQIKNLINGKLYIGSATNLKRRNREHFYLLRNNKHDNKYLQNAYNKYGEENFIFEILEIIEDKSKLLEIEQLWLDKFKTYRRCNGYNICKNAGNTLGYKHTKKAKLNMSKKKKGFTPWNKGKKVPSLSLGNNPNSKKVIRLSDGVIYNSLLECGIALNLGKNTIANHCKNITKNRDFMYLSDFNKLTQDDIKDLKIKMLEDKIIRISDNKIFNTIQECAKLSNVSFNTVSRHCNKKIKNIEAKFMFYKDFLKI